MTVSEGENNQGQPSSGDNAENKTTTGVTIPATTTTITAAATSPTLKTYSDDEVNGIVSRKEKAAAKAATEAAEKKFAEQLGVPLDEAKQLIKQRQEQEEAQKTELEREREARQRIEAESKQQIASVAESDHAKAVKLQLLLAGVPLPEDVAEKQKALDSLSGFIRVPVGSSVEEIDGAIEGLKTQFPQLFEAPTPKANGNPPSNPSGRPSTPSLGVKTADQIGAELAAERNALRGVKPPA